MLRLSCLLFSLFFGLSLLAQQDHPNILLLIADDLGVDRLNGYHDGTLMAVTPTLDSLRAAGITFTNAAASPVCSPTRAAIMTGKYGTKTGVLGVPGDLDPAQGSLFEALADNTSTAYADALIGKWHLTNPLRADDPLTFGPDVYEGFLRGGVDDYYGWSRIKDGEATLSTEHVTAALTNSASAWVADQGDNPWFLWLAHAAPHSPYHVPPAGTFSISNTNGNTNQYVAMVENLDYEIRRLLAGMAPDVRDNTLIIFVGDNGTPNNVMQDYPDGHGKASVYQGGVRVPLIIAGKGVTRTGVREEALVHVTDIYATVLEAAGTQVQGGFFNGLSFYGLLSDNAATTVTRDYNYVEVSNSRSYDWAIRDRRYKLIDFGNGDPEFYDLAMDSFEVNNLLAGGLSAELEAIKADLEAEANAIQNGWSCRDHIRNGDETGIDCGTDACGMCTTATSSPLIRADVSVYPNPCTDYLLVDALGERIREVLLYDSAGRLLQRTDGQGLRMLRINVSGVKATHLMAEVRTVAGAVALIKVARVQ